ncbi:alkaline phosphatase family protein [Aliikangiella marina]|uniref:Alkaline phosphatase family protein n=1 Tax=Aliikangiella marina TaxID=1712262 RepID=A0A545THQ1_9GAMM|nr:alkaline phosphatase D family protein [Aliikangiella marina]TQV76728.1 alkaline phosphatase family protein [Aliikangiella marina]
MKSFLEIRYKLFFLITLCLFLTSKSALGQVKSELKIAFGSCAKQDRPQFVWQKIGEQNPDLFIFSGDNVYIDSDQTDAMQHAYKMLGSNPNFSKFRQSTPILATWDDHDYGMQDGNKYFTAKEAAKTEFINFWRYPEIEQLRHKPQGIFHTYWTEHKGKKVQIILLDTRWYRDPMVFADLTEAQRVELGVGPYKEHVDTSKTLLGEIQWEWFANELKKPADFRVVVSSIAVLAEHTGWDSWANYPHELEKLLALLHPVNQGNLVIISGDIHKAEISQRTYNGKIFTDVSSSGLDAAIYPAAPNQYRFGNPLLDNNFGVLTLTGDERLKGTIEVLNAKGEAKLTLSLGDD